MVGLGRSRQRMVFSKKRSHSRRYSPLKPGSSGVFFWSSISCGLPRSWPAEKCLPAPARMITRTSASSTALLNASSSSSSRTRDWAFSTSGRLVVILCTAPVRSVSKVEKVFMTCSSSCQAPAHEIDEVVAIEALLLHRADTSGVHRHLEALDRMAPALDMRVVGREQADLVARVGDDPAGI